MDTNEVLLIQTSCYDLNLVATELKALRTAAVVLDGGQDVGSFLRNTTAELLVSKVVLVDQGKRVGVDLVRCSVCFSVPCLLTVFLVIRVDVVDSSVVLLEYRLASILHGLEPSSPGAGEDLGEKRYPGVISRRVYIAGLVFLYQFQVCDERSVHLILYVHLR